MRQLKLIFAALFLISPFAANADVISVGFFQDGFDEGAFLIGTYSGVDRDGDGRISTWVRGPRVDEDLSFSLFFSGNSIVPAFTLTGLHALLGVPGFSEDDFDDIHGVNFDLEAMLFGSFGSSEWELIDPSRIGGDDNWLATSPHVFFWTAFGGSTRIRALEPRRLARLARGPATYSYEPLQVYAIPEPGTLALLGIGLFGMGLARRNRKA